MDIQDVELFAKARDSVRDALSRFQEQQTDANFVDSHRGRYSEWTTSFSSVVPNWAIQPLRHPSAATIVANQHAHRYFSTQYPPVSSLLNYLRSTPPYNTYYPQQLRERDRTREGAIMRLLHSMLVGYLGLANDTSFQEEVFEQVYFPVEAYLTRRTLSVNVLVPILFVGFELSTEYEISPQVSIVPIAPSLQQSRMAEFPTTSNSMQRAKAAGAATHAFKFTGSKLDNSTWLQFWLSQYRARVKHSESIERCFAALRIVTGFALGYDQIILEPVGWAKKIDSYSNSIYVTSTTNYSERAWNDVQVAMTGDLSNIPVLNAEDLSEVRSIFGGLRMRGKMRVAVDRLNDALSRDDYAEMLVDATIALEALLGDGAHGEISHKLALRTAALSQFYRHRYSDPYTIYKRVKDQYEERSKIVHGSRQQSARYSPEPGNSRESSRPNPLGSIEHLQIAFSVLARHPRLLESGLIDKVLILSALKQVDMHSLVTSIDNLK